jgi:hypothetical protein
VRHLPCTLRTRAALVSTLPTKPWAQRPEEPDYQKLKDDALRKQQAGKAHWQPELATESEADVKADHAPSLGRTAAEDIRRLQEKTKDVPQEKERLGTSVGDGL